jgi:hypothetical protein
LRFVRFSTEVIQRLLMLLLLMLFWVAGCGGLQEILARVWDLVNTSDAPI